MSRRTGARTLNLQNGQGPTAGIDGWTRPGPPLMLPRRLPVAPTASTVCSQFSKAFRVTDHPPILLATLNHTSNYTPTTTLNSTPTTLSTKSPTASLLGTSTYTQDRRNRFGNSRQDPFARASRQHNIACRRHRRTQPPSNHPLPPVASIVLPIQAPDDWGRQGCAHITIEHYTPRDYDCARH